ncbi:META domain-containing protein [Brumimicrobium mesophilum]|uniref:META domain-containing protein n=1 Tax=Brumimicrobium mesophilum TaxID=392717 RepID=UPI000D13F72E|nr:META domain-containing protein [Brumimicrobium mesophilum]
MKKITLILMSSTLLILGSCGNSKEKMDDKVEQLTSEVMHQDMSNVDFYANAKDESWKLSVSYNGKIVFTDTKNNIAFISEDNEKQVAQGADVLNINAKNETHVIRVNVDIADCMATGKQVNIMVREISKKEGFDYSGCGFYRGKPQLHDIWALKELNGQPITADQFPREAPHFEFNLTTKRMSGFAGCNQVNGNISFGYNKMIIDKLSSTRMYCGETSKIEEEILTILESEPVYDHHNLNLTIESKAGSLVLKKVD